MSRVTKHRKAARSYVQSGMFGKAQQHEERADQLEFGLLFSSKAPNQMPEQTLMRLKRLATRAEPMIVETGTAEPDVVSNDLKALQTSLQEKDRNIASLTSQLKDTKTELTRLTQGQRALETKVSDECKTRMKEKDEQVKTLGKRFEEMQKKCDECEKKAKSSQGSATASKPAAAEAPAPPAPQAPLTSQAASQQKHTPGLLSQIRDGADLKDHRNPRRKRAPVDPVSNLDFMRNKMSSVYRIQNPDADEPLDEDDGFVDKPQRFGRMRNKRKMNR